MSPGVATPWPAAPPMPMAKVCCIAPSLTECRPTQTAPALGRAQLIVAFPVERLLIRLTSLRGGVYTHMLTRRILGRTGARYFRLQLVNLLSRLFLASIRD